MPPASIQVESISFPPTLKPPPSPKPHFLCGAGVRGLEIEGKFIKFTAIGVYLEDDAVAALSPKWKGKSADELNGSVEFFREIVTGDFEKCMRVVFILPLTGKHFADKVAENCQTTWKSLRIYSEAEGEALQKFQQEFDKQTFPPASSILFTQFPNGTFAITFSKDESVPEVESFKIESKLVSEVILDSMIGEHGASPAARKSMASNLSELMKECCENGSKAAEPETDQH